MSLSVAWRSRSVIMLGVPETATLSPLIIAGEWCLWHSLFLARILGFAFTMIHSVIIKFRGVSQVPVKLQVRSFVRPRSALALAVPLLKPNLRVKTSGFGFGSSRKGWGHGKLRQAPQNRISTGTYSLDLDTTAVESLGSVSTTSQTE